MKRSILMVMAAAFFTAVPVCMAAGTVSLPKGYEKWEKSRQQLVNDKKSLFYGIHYTYVNKKAMKTYKKSGTYPEGSMFVVVQYGIRQEGGKPVQGKKSMIVLMKKDKSYKETGGWLFAGYTPQGKPSGIDPVKNCYECHQKEASERDLVISRYAEFR